jgi:hypothetical protein
VYVVLLIGTILAVVAILFVVLAVWSDGLRERRRRVAMYALGSGAMLGVVAILIALRFAQPSVCRALGGDWYPDRGDVCRDEWGGNGSNDPSYRTWLELIYNGAATAPIAALQPHLHPPLSAPLS